MTRPIASRVTRFKEPREHSCTTVEADGQRYWIQTETWQFAGSWCGSKICEERKTNQTTHFFSRGFELAGQNFFLTKDHLQSVREICMPNGTVEQRRDYRPYGASLVVFDGGQNTNFPLGFTGHYQYRGPYVLSPTRIYDSERSIWLSRDWVDGLKIPNLYTYVRNNPLRYVDPLGGFEFPSSSELFDEGIDEGISIAVEKFISAAAGAATSMVLGSVQTASPSSDQQHQGDVYDPSFHKENTELFHTNNISNGRPHRQTLRTHTLNSIMSGNVGR